MKANDTIAGGMPASQVSDAAGGTPASQVSDAAGGSSYLEERVYRLMGLSPEQCAVPLYRGSLPAWRAKVWYDRKGNVIGRNFFFVAGGDRQAYRAPSDAASGDGCVPSYRVTAPEGSVREEWVKDSEGRFVAAPFPLFQSDDKDNILMYPYTLDGQVITYLRDNQPKYTEGDVEDMYCITRLNPAYLKSHPDMPKYKFPGGATKKGTYPFFPPALYYKYQAGAQIETLVLTEGYMKAMCASVRGMDVVGLGSITLFADQKTKQLYPDIVKLINKCQPRNIVVLYDGDCTDLGKDALRDVQAGKVADLSKRPQMFRSALLKLRDLLLEFKYKREDGKEEPCELFFAYVEKRDEQNPPKGLDDLLVDDRYKDQTADIATDLNTPGRPGIYFKKVNLRTGLNKISTLFGLRSPEKFYEMWAEEIGLKRFKYEGSVYEYVPDAKKLEQILDSSLDDYIAVGGDIVLVTEEPAQRYIAGESDERRHVDGKIYRFYPKPDKVINARFGDKTAQKIYRYKYYEDFTVIPSHTDYKREILNTSGYKFYNMYQPLPYQPEQGRWDTIDRLLHQITKVYDEEVYHYYEMLLDWITLSYFRPLQFLPIITLVSQERGTGKTSFLNLLKGIYGNNAVIGGNDLIVSKFNTMLEGKLIVGVDESCLGDNKEVGESLKYMSTARTMHIEPKGKDKKEVPAFVKFVLCTNEVRKGIFISNDEVRFWVMRLTPWEDVVAGGDRQAYRDPSVVAGGDRQAYRGPSIPADFEERVKEEIPAFLYYLTDRYYKNGMYVKQFEHRMWFRPSRLMNDDLKVMMSGTQSNFEGSLREYLHDMFLDTQRLKLAFDIKNIVEQVPDAKRKDQQYIRNLLKDMKGVRQMEGGRYSIAYRVTADEAKMPDCQYLEGEIKWSKKMQCRPFEFDAAYFLNASEYKALVDKIEAENAPAPLPPEQASMAFDDTNLAEKIDNYGWDLPTP